MVTVIHEEIIGHEKQTRSVAISQHEPSHQLLLQSKFINHHPKSGLNPLVDAAALLFSMMGKLKQIKSYRHLGNLQKELVQEINAFQDTIKSQNYSSEYLLVSRYAICATLDDIISSTTWGAQGQWDSYSLLSAFNQESITQERFFAILERLIKDPALYIDIMELMYICLSLGFKGHYRSGEFNHHQLEQIISSLYKRIRAYRGDFSKILSPLPIKLPASQKTKAKQMPAWLVALLVAGASLALFAGMRYLLNMTSIQAYQDLTQIGKSISHDQTTSE